MARDYKNVAKPAAKKAKPAGTTPGWVWLSAGLAIGLFVALLVYLKDYRVATPPAPKAAVTPPAATADKAPAKAETPAAAKPRFDFYNLLPEMEVLIPDQEIATEREREPSESVIYYLQAASFRQYQDADRMRAQLALMNIESQIQRVTVDDAKTWFRVRIGPFSSARAMDRVRGRLRAANIDPIVLKVKQPS